MIVKTLSFILGLAATMLWAQYPCQDWEIDGYCKKIAQDYPSKQKVLASCINSENAFEMVFVESCQSGYGHGQRKSVEAPMSEEDIEQYVKTHAFEVWWAKSLIPNEANRACGTMALEAFEMGFLRGVKCPGAIQ